MEAALISTHQQILLVQTHEDSFDSRARFRVLLAAAIHRYSWVLDRDSQCPAAMTLLFGGGVLIGRRLGNTASALLTHGTNHAIINGHLAILPPKKYK